MHGMLGLLSRARYPGKYKVYRMLDRMALLSGAIHQTVGPYSCRVPADDFSCWKTCGRNYQNRRILRFSNILNEIEDDFALLDLGAHVGLISLMIMSLCPRVQKIIAVDPNPHSFNYLSSNLAMLDIPTEIIRAAVSNFDGVAKFSFDKRRSADPSGHLDELGEESIDIVQVDSIYEEGFANIALKIDVEGEEKNVLEGAARTIGMSQFAAIFLEIHPGVMKRRRISPEEIFRAAERIRPFRWCLADEGLPEVERSKAFFEQFSDGRQYDVIGIASAG